MFKTPFTATAIWLRDAGNGYAEVLVEIDGKWHVAIKESVGKSECTYSHIAEGRGQSNWTLWPENETILPEELYENVEDLCCPYCKGELLFEQSEASISTNVKCKECDNRFNIIIKNNKVMSAYPIQRSENDISRDN